MAASRSRRANAGALMSGLIKDFHEEEAYSTLYGGFTEEVNDDEFGLDKVSDSGSDVDIDDEEEDLDDDVQEGQDDDEEGRRKRKRPTKGPFAAFKQKPSASQPKAKKQKTVKAPSPPASEDEYDEDEDLDDEAPTPSTSSGNGEDSRDAFSVTEFGSQKKKKPSVTPSSRSIRDSTAAKRFETEEMESLREQRRQELGPRKKIKHRIPSQAERVQKSIQTEKKNKADLERHARDEEENEKKKSRKIKVTKGPFVSCFISTTQSMPYPRSHDDSLLEEDLESFIHQPGDKYSRNLLAFSDEEVLRQYFPETPKLKLPEPRYCIVTGRPAKYRDPVTLQYYSDAQALHALRGVLYKHLLANPTLLSIDKVLEYVNWYEAKYKVERTGDHSQVGKYDYSSNVVQNGTTADGTQEAISA